LIVLKISGSVIFPINLILSYLFMPQLSPLLQLEPWLLVRQQQLVVVQPLVVIALLLLIMVPSVVLEPRVPFLGVVIAFVILGNLLLLVMVEVHLHDLI
jgi:hypothetical protein